MFVFLKAKPVFVYLNNLMTFFLFVGYSRRMLSKFFSRLFLASEHVWFCVVLVFVGLVSVEDFVESCCF